MGNSVRPPADRFSENFTLCRSFFNVLTKQPINNILNRKPKIEAGALETIEYITWFLVPIWHLYSYDYQNQYKETNSILLKFKEPAIFTSFYYTVNLYYVYDRLIMRQWYQK